MRSLIGAIGVAGLLGLGGMALPGVAGAAPIGNIAGTVTNVSTGKAVPYALVCTEAGGEQICELANESGEYTIPSLEEGEYTVEFTGETCYYTFFCETAYGKKVVTHVKVEAGEISEVNAALTPLVGSISGRVTSGGVPLENIYVCPSSEGTFFGGECTTTNANGEYMLKEVRSGVATTVRFESLDPTSCKSFTCREPVNYLSQYWHNQATEQTANTITVETGKITTGINAEMQPGGHIAGKVTNASITPEAVAGIEVCAASTATYTTGKRVGEREFALPERCAWTNASGEYNIQTLASSNYEVTFYGAVCAEPKAGETKCPLVYLDEVYPTAVSVTAPNTTSGINGMLLEVSPAKPTNSAAPAVTGTAAVGSVLSCSQGTWGNKPTGLTYRWLRNGAAIAGQSANTYTVQSADQGTGVACEVTATNGAGSTAATSNTVAIPKPTPGTVVVESASVKGATVTVKLRCTGANACSGTVKLIAKTKSGHGKHSKTHSASVGVASYSMGVGKHSTLHIQLTGKGRKLLRKAGRKGLEVEVAGSNVQVHTVVLKAHRR